MKKRISMVVFGIIFVSLMIVGGIYDLQISTAVADPSCGWAWVIEVAAEPPTILLCSLMCGVIFFRLWNERKISPGRTPLAVFMFIAEIGTVISTVTRTLNYLDLSLWIAVPVVPVLSLILFLIARPVEKRMTAEMIDTTISCVAAAFIVLMTINAVKYLWGRVRYRDMYAIGDFTQFTPWYQLNGINGNKSFPSGHTSNVVLLFYLSYYTKYLRKNKVKIIVTGAVLISLWVIVTMVSRVAIGAHYLSDVTAGAAVTGVIVYVVGLMRKEYKQTKKLL